MNKIAFIILIGLFLPAAISASDTRVTINLNGIWEFDQTPNAFPPKTFTRKIEVPGLITLAEPKIEDYYIFLQRPGKAEMKNQHNLYNMDYTPKYSWYRKSIFIGKENEASECVIGLKKSQYVTRVYINGIDLGTSMECFTPVEFRATHAIKFGSLNEILVMVGDRIWLPSEAAGGTDKEKEHYIPGIWDDVTLTFTGKMRIHKILILPSVINKQVVIKTLIRNFNPSQIYYGDPMNDSVTINIVLSERLTGKTIAGSTVRFSVRRDNLTELKMEIPVENFTRWTPENPFLYQAEITITDKKGISDQTIRHFGMRDFTKDGKYFTLNGQKYFLRGTNITLQRFFEDPDCHNLVWNREWVKRLLIDYPKRLNWNAMRICVGIVPDFWYDLADEYGLVFQNEWMYWQNHGWNEEIRKEYTNWVWSDGSHPSIVIWDAINENQDVFIGNILIPELKKLDPTRIWDAGYMTGEQIAGDEMDEPHPYQGPWNQDIREFEKHPYPLGNLDYKPGIIQNIESSASVQLVNEYGWIWLWRNGTPSKLTVGVYEYYLGPNSTDSQNRELQAYWLQAETEWLRSNTSVAGVLAFCYLANNYGYTGDWFINDISNLEPSPTLKWFKHCFAPAAIFINLTDERYTKFIKPHKPGSVLNLNLAGINNNPDTITGSGTLRLVNYEGLSVSDTRYTVLLKPGGRTEIIEKLILPSKTGGYLVVAEFTPSGTKQKIISRRFIRVGEAKTYKYFDLKPEELTFPDLKE